MVTFSIITCTFNAEGCLEQTLNSVAQQTYPHIEHLIIDGLSKDSTVAIARRYAEKEERHAVSVVSEADKGLYDAMNKGIDRAKGDYIIWMNAGDAFASASTLADVAALLQKEDALLRKEDAPLQKENALPGVIYGDTDIVNEKGEFLHKRRLRPPHTLSWRSFRDGMLVCHQSFYAKTSIAKLTKYDLSYRFSADVDWCIRIMKECEKQSLTLLNTHLTLTSYLDGGLSVKNHRASLMDRFKVMKTHYGLITTLLQHAWFVVRAVKGKIFKA